MRFALALLFVPMVCLAQTGSPWQMEPSETTADLRGIHAVGGGVVWASGTGGTVLRSQDSGFEWQQCAIPHGAEKLDFRGIWAWDDQTAIVMSSGPGSLSRLYKTVDGCAHWTLLYSNLDKDGFWDGIAFYDREHGFLIGDPVNGSLVLQRTEDGGRTWTPVPASGLDAGKRGLFAASNSSLALGVAADKNAAGAGNLPWIGTSGLAGSSESSSGSSSGGALVLSGTMDSCIVNKPPQPTQPCRRRYTFHHDPVPLSSDRASAGVFSLVTRNNSNGTRNAIAVGGDYTKPDGDTGTAAWWSSGSNRWTAAAKPPGGYRSAVAWDAENKLWIAVGPNGSDVSRDDGRTWQSLEHAPPGTPKGGEWNALSLPWAVGPHGHIGKLNTDAATPPK